MTLTGIAFVSLSLSLQPAPATEQAPGGGAAQEAEPAADDQKEVCRHKRVRGHGGERTGARVPVRKVCKTKAEWRAESGK